MSEAPIPKFVAPGAGRAYLLADDLVTVKAAATETGGAYALFERRIAPGGGLPPHLHRYEDEAAFVLAGTLSVQLDDRTFATGAGGYVFVPRATPHAFANPGPHAARLLILVSPGGLRELLVAEIGVPVIDPTSWGNPEGRGHPPSTDATSRQAGIARIAAAVEKYGTEFLTPSHPNSRPRSERSTTP